MVIATKKDFTRTIFAMSVNAITQKLSMTILNMMSIAIVEWGTTNWGRKLIGKLPRLHRVITGSNPVASTNFVLSYTPEILGFPFSEIRQINIDHCPYMTLDRIVERAHTHIFPDDGNVCVWSDQLFDEYGNPSDTMWHEYAHILSKEGHTIKWYITLEKLGKRDLAKRYFPYLFPEYYKKTFSVNLDTFFTDG